MRECDIEIGYAVEIAALKAAPLFALLGWNTKENRRLSVDELQNDIYQLLRDLSGEGEYRSVSTGHFKVTKELAEDRESYNYTINLTLSSLFGLPKNHAL